MTDELGPRPIPVVELRAATVADLTLLETDRAAFAQRMGSPAPGGWPEFPEAVGFTIDRLLSHPFEADWWMHYFLLNGLIVGSGGYVGRPKKRVAEIGYEIAPGFRGRGLGSELLSAAEVHAREKGCRVVILSSHSFQAPDFYVRRGYQQVAQISDYPVGYDDIVLVKRL